VNWGMDAWHESSAGRMSTVGRSGVTRGLFVREDWLLPRKFSPIFA
jgi:hypothetical protein